MRRDPSVDLARGVACVLMIQTHAFHGWVAPALQDNAGFRFTRWLGSFPLPTFLLLAGVSLALRVTKSVSAGEVASVVRIELARRALGVVALGYATNLLWALINGGASWDGLLRADVLHAIGFSLLLMASLVVGTADGTIDVARLRRRALVVALSVSVLCPFITRATSDLSGPWRYVVAPFSEVSGLTVMPVVPLTAWCALGVVLGLWLNADVTMRTRRHTPLCVLGALSVVLGAEATAMTSAYLQTPLSRASFAVWPNLWEGAGRGLCLLWLGTWLTRHLPLRAQRVLAGFGSASLVVYVAHVPFCYGRLAGPLRGSLSLSEAAPWVLLLMLGSYGVVLARAWMKARRLGAATLRSSA